MIYLVAYVSQVVAVHIETILSNSALPGLYLLRGVLLVQALHKETSAIDGPHHAFVVIILLLFVILP
jgi:hypothetical protein